MNIAKGYSIQELSDAERVRSLGTEPYVAEILARALGSLAMGACTAEHFPELVAVEFGHMGLKVPDGVSAESAMQMLGEVQSMVKRFNGLAPGESMDLQFRGPAIGSSLSEGNQSLYLLRSREGELALSVRTCRSDPQIGSSIAVSQPQEPPSVGPGHFQILVEAARPPRCGHSKQRHPPGKIATKCYGCYNSGMKSRVITQRELRNQSAAVLREVEAGRTVVVTRNGTPIGELRPIRRRRFVPRAAISDAATRAPRIDAGRFRADLDAVINPHIHD